MRFAINVYFLIILLPLVSVSQDRDDTSHIIELDQIVITATRTERKLGNIAVPVQIITKQSIRNAGMVRLNDVLSEQTGLYITSSGATSSAGGGVFGNGVQIQGLSPDYTLILLDGEPIIGRQGGVIDLTRLSVTNIKRIEIVKGPSSSLYGSEAMGGVVNIISEQAKAKRLDAGFRYGRFNAMDANLTAAFREKNWGLQMFGNRNSSSGYDLDRNQPGKTVDPFYNYTGQLRSHLDITSKTRAALSARYFYEDQSNYFTTIDLVSGAPVSISGNGVIRDLNLNPIITHQFASQVKSSLRLYFSRYEYEQNLVNQDDKSLYYSDYFRQDYYRAENQTDLTIKNHFLSFGAGMVWEKLNTNRYAGERVNQNKYFFAQDDWRFNEKITAIGGFRFDNNTAYQSRLSPKLALHYKAGAKLSFTASYGSGFKAPDFRQLFLNFLNTAAGGYVIYGANEITLADIERQKQEGTIAEILPRAYQLSLLRPERSNGINLGMRYDISDEVTFNANLFRNDIDDLIQVDVIAYRSNGAPVYSYFNVRKAFTEGIELNGSCSINEKWTASGGYQFLLTADKEDLRRIRQGSVFTRDPETNESYKVRRGDYGGLPNRSAHLANAKLNYNSKGWVGSLRAIYKSKWGTTDQDGNNLINRDDEFAPGFIQVNISCSRELGPLRLQAGVDNLFDQKDPLYLQAQPGIQPYVSVQYSFINKKQTVK
jgi:outer membrane receptor for ferrienterochelin and colicins